MLIAVWPNLCTSLCWSVWRSSDVAERKNGV